MSKGDTLYSISRKYNTTVDAIKNYNNLTSDTLSINKQDNNIVIGEVLKIPNVNKEAKYIVKKGDTLYSIAKRFNTTVDKLIEDNKLIGNILSIGEELII